MTARPSEPSLLEFWRRIRTHLEGHHRIFLFAGAMAAVDATSQALIPLFFRRVLDSLQANPDRFFREELGPAFGLACALAVIFFAAAYFFHAGINVGAARLTCNLQASLHAHVQRLSVDFFQRNRVGEISARLNSDLESINTAMGSVAYALWAAFGLVFGLAALFWIDAPLAGLMTLVLVIVTWATHHFLPVIRRMNREVRDATGEVSAMVTEYVGIHSLIKAYAREDLATGQVRSGTDRVRRSREHLAWRMFAFNDGIQVLTRFVAPFLLLFVGAWRVVHGHMSIGDIVAFWGIWLLLGNQISAVYSSLSQIFSAAASFDRIEEFFAEQPLIRDAADARDVTARGRVEFDHVTFRYPGTNEGPVLQDISFTLEPGRKVALVGPSGAGKSTLILLLLRFYDPLSGALRLDGHDLREITQASLRRHIGVVLQESILFSGSIAENLRLAKPDATDAELIAALQAASAWEFIGRLSDGLHTVIGERGARLSGGQKQRLSIARVFLKDPPILLLDEATSALDSVSEQLVQEAMDRLMTGRTTLVVAHRISTVKNADNILVLRSGRVEAQGRHAELLETSPLYRELCSHQNLE
jgi:ABC-type multidrug transport system fused ATPase/permease subunit